MADLVVAGVGDVADPSAHSLDIINIGEAKLALNIASGDSTIDGELAQVITAASRFVDHVLGPVVKRIIRDEAHHSVTGAALELRHAPVDSLTTVTSYVGLTPTTLAVEDFPAAVTESDVRLINGGRFGRLERRSSGYPTRFAADRVVVTYVAGRFIDTGTVERDFKEAAAITAIHMWQHRGAGSGAAISGGEGPLFGAVPFSSKVLRDKLRMLYVDQAAMPLLGG